MSKRITAVILTLLVLVLVAGSAHALERPELTRGADSIVTPAMSHGLCVSNVFQSNMVVQRDKPIHVWGWAAPGEKVTVSFAGNAATATADDGRAWKVELPALDANAAPQTMTIKAGGDTLTFDNILIGDVWVLGGQSNMEFPISRVQDGALEIASANFPDIRMLTVPQLPNAEPIKSFPRQWQWSGWSKRHYPQGFWEECSPETVTELSAIGYVFARRLHMATRVPIGVIDTSIGGTTLETWTPRSAIAPLEEPAVKALVANWAQQIAEFDPHADLAQRVARHHEWVKRMTDQGKQIPADRVTPTDLRPGPVMDRNRPGNCYNGLIAPLEGLAVKGAIWHQGYNNCFNGTEGAVVYRHVFPQMIKAWRSAFGDDEMAFGIITLCTQGKAQEHHDFSSHLYDAGPYIRQAQYQTYLRLLEAGDKNIGFATTYDLRRRWYHPQLKIPAGERIARWALNTQYGMTNLRWKPAMITDTQVEDDKIVLTFDVNVAPVDQQLPMVGFAIAGEDRRFHPAEANHKVTGKDSRGRDKRDMKIVELTSPMVPNPVAFRYAWARSPMGNVEVHHNSDVLIATQRSDDWPMEQVPLIDLDGETDRRRIGGMIRQALGQIDVERKVAEAKAVLEAHSPAEP